ncbi:hypothetical protein [Chryseobacterium sp.]|uniref:hypothetical protein n=1 Tax=Chryseobacterium sp. TaxID=1871047 RepID=UPI00289ECB8A|nr:hypothetical protein [Chryseobacterium sp.]
MAQKSEDSKKPVLPPTNVTSPQPVEVKGNKTGEGKTTINIASKIGAIRTKKG